MIDFPECPLPLCNGKIYCAGSSSEHGLAWVRLECSKCRLSFTHTERLKRCVVDRNDCIEGGWSETQSRMIGPGSWYSDPYWDQITRNALKEFQGLSSEEIERLKAPKNHLSCRRRKRRSK